MRRYLLGLAASSLALIGLAEAPTAARADHHGWDHHHGWYRGHRGWDHGWHHWRGSYGPYPSYYVAPYYGFSYPYYVAPYYAYPSYGFGFVGPRLSVWVGP
jgi:hypothetical protein